MRRLQFFAPVARGLEEICAEELRSLSVADVRPARAGVSFAGDLADGYRACLWSRTASRVLLRIAEVPATSPEELYDGVRALPWEDHLSVDGTLAVDFTSARSPIMHTQYGALKVKDAIVDRFRDRVGRRPDVDTLAPDVRVNVAARARSAVVSIDLAGDALHRRGYREPGVQAEAPLRETLAAGVLLLAGWPRMAEAGGTFVDPMCGSGTLVIEAAMIAADRAPGLLRTRWGFERWLGHDAEAWDAMLDEADERAEAGLARPLSLLGSDADPGAIALARACATRAGIESRVRFEEADARELAPPEPPGLVALNPPYGERLGASSDLEALYAGVGARLRAAWLGWRVAVMASDDALLAAMGLPVAERHELFNGRIPVTLAVAPLAERPEDSMFANRLRKNAKRLAKWARREGVTCYRVYDADMPEYSAAIEVFEGAGPDAGKRWARVAEYAPPPTIDEADAQRRLAEIMASVPEVLGVAPEDVVLKVRRRQRGSEQYERSAEERRPAVVAEGGLLFELDLGGYLDTGLFLDHRITRSMLRDASKEARVLNLFAYTGTATVYAAAGGARETVSVDLSRTYLERAKRNLELNGLNGSRHVFVRADAVEWLAGEGTRSGTYDIVFCDPPTFSTSKRMDQTFDVQRDHVALIKSSAALLAPGGVLYFSTNRAGFKLDEAGLEGLVLTDMTAETIPEDFARTPRVHRLWRITRTGGQS